MMKVFAKQILLLKYHLLQCVEEACLPGCHAQHSTALLSTTQPPLPPVSPEKAYILFTMQPLCKAPIMEPAPSLMSSLSWPR